MDMHPSHDPCAKIQNMAGRFKVKQYLHRGWQLLRIAVLVVILSFILGGSIIPATGLTVQVRGFTRGNEFNFATWTLEAIGAKLLSWGLSVDRFLTPEAQSDLVLNYLAQVQQVNGLNAEIIVIYTNPNIPDPEQVSQTLRIALDTEMSRLNSLAPMAEAVLQAQLMAVIQESSLSFLGQALPPSLYQVSDIPQSLVVSPRTEIRQVFEVSLTPSISLAFKDQLETAIFSKLDHAALVVPIGGIGTYPTMVMQTTDLVWLTDTIAHEWVHNFLSLRPLGINYFTNEALRTINETTASLAGQELGFLVLEKYYPEFLPASAVPLHTKMASSPIEDISQEEIFNFQAEIHKTRVEADRLLAKGDVAGAEAYMEARRLTFWENGYPIRKLNQAYFAFYGAYSTEVEGGAAGEDPVGPAVQALRARYPELADFLNAISRVTSYDALLKLLEP
ncbi:MAG: hypothetical protein GX142_04615 [Chloroflexi bacterium]|nr:hypothetical protein [Chloroflexota bacterium]